MCRVMNKVIVHALFIIGVLGCGLLIGINNIPGDWYQSLAKPAFNPPNWIFAPAWTFLYILIGITGARTFIAHRHTSAMRLWVAQLVFNFAWSPLFFGFHEIGLALIVIIALLATIIGFMIASRGQDRVSVVLFVPYLLWVSFATLLNLSILLLN